MEVTCATCAITFDRPKANIRPGQIKHFCSTQCASTSVTRSCPVCGSTFKRKPAELRSVNYCSVSCSAKANMTLQPIAKGERRGVTTEFVKGQRPTNVLPVGSVTTRVRHKRGRDTRAWVKVAEPNVWRERAVVVWESANGPRPRGLVIHHINGDPLDDRPENLVALTRAEHAALHATTSPNMSS